MKRPLSVTILACVYIAVGAVGFVFHFGDLRTISVFRYDGLWIELTEVLAIVSGAFLLRGRNWARWLAVAWIAFHVVVSASEPLPWAMHLLFGAAIAFVLFRREAARYFRGVG